MHLGPVFGEVPLTLIQVARRHSSFLSIDLQGFLRSRAQGGIVKLRPVELVETFRFLDLVKSTADEALVQTSGQDLVSAVKRILEEMGRLTGSQAIRNLMSSTQRELETLWSVDGSQHSC